MKTYFTSLRMVIALTALTGIAYPLSVWAFGQAFFKAQAEGSLLYRKGAVVGSALLSQKTTGPGYFWPRPSAGDYATVASGASNYAWTSAKLQKAIADADASFRAANPIKATEPVPAEMLTASGSGLDPDISPEAARLQTARICKARGIGAGAQPTLDALIARMTVQPLLSQPTVNVLKLNLALDEAFPKS